MIMSYAGWFFSIQNSTCCKELYRDGTHGAGYEQPLSATNNPRSSHLNSSEVVTETHRKLQPELTGSYNRISPEVTTGTHWKWSPELTGSYNWNSPENGHWNSPETVTGTHRKLQLELTGSGRWVVTWRARPGERWGPRAGAGAAPAAAGRRPSQPGRPETRPCWR